MYLAPQTHKNRSGIGANPVSVAYAAVQLISQLFVERSALKVFLIGSGETASLVAKYLHQQGVRHFMIASRTPKHAQKLADSFGGTILTIGDIPQYLSQADVVVSATSCPCPLLTRAW